MKHLLYLLLIITLTISSCKKEEPEIILVSCDIELITLSEYAITPENSDTWDLFVGDGPDCVFKIFTGGQEIFESQVYTDLSGFEREYDEGLPFTLEDITATYKIQLLDKDSNDNDDLMAEFTWTPNSSEAVDEITFSNDDTTFYLQMSWE